MAGTSTRSWGELANIAAASITIITALVGVFGWFAKRLPWFQEQPETLAFVWLFWAGAGVLLLVGLFLLWRGLSRKSRLLRPEALRLDPDEHPEHLRGREDDIERVSGAVARAPLVFLEGESGAGKSALIRAGLNPALAKTDPPALLPVYMNTYTGDWENGIREQLIMALWAALGEERRARLGIGTRNELRGELSSMGPSAEDAGLLSREGKDFERVDPHVGPYPSSVLARSADLFHRIVFSDEINLRGDMQ